MSVAAMAALAGAPHGSLAGAWLIRKPRLLWSQQQMPERRFSIPNTGLRNRARRRGPAEANSGLRMLDSETFGVEQHVTSTNQPVAAGPAIPNSECQASRGMTSCSSLIDRTVALCASHEGWARTTYHAPLSTASLQSTVSFPSRDGARLEI